MKKKDDFVHLHTHSDMSQLDGCGKIGDYVDEAVKRGHKGIAFAEHGTMRGVYTLLTETRDKPIKPIYGVEFYVCGDMDRRGITEEEKADITKGLKKTEARDAIKKYESEMGFRDRWHLTVWAKNNVGLRNLYKLSSDSYLRGFYYKPRIDLKALIEHSEGLMVGTGCTSSAINDLVSRGKRKKALERADMLHEAFGEDLWIEIMPHDFLDQVQVNKFALELRDRFPDSRLMATQDAHYVHREDSIHHEVLLCIGTNDKLSNPNRFRFTGSEFHFRTRLEMFQAFRKVHGYLSKEQIKEALDSTVMFTEAIETKIEIDRFKCLMPHIETPETYGGDEYKWLVDLCKEGWHWREINDRAERLAKREGIKYEAAVQQYRRRLRMELRAIKSQKFVSYFMLVWDLYDWVRKQGIMCGPGRGSAAGSLVSFLIGVTSVDPVEHKLLFERFISPSRVDMPDIDMDFEDVRRQEIIERLRDRYGHDKVAQIATVGRLSGKQCLKDVSRVLEVPYAEVNQVTNSIIERSSGDERASQTIEDSFKDFKVCREFNAKYPDVLKHAKCLEGMAKNLGIHAAGVVTSPVPLTDLVPLEIRKHDGRDVVVTALDMHGVQAMGLLKLDVLGLRTLAVLKDALNFVEKRTGKEIDLERLVLDDKEVLQGFTDHDYIGVFQYDSPSADKICEGVQFIDFEDVAAMTALNRPGTARSGLASQYVARKKDPRKIKETAFHPKVSEITKDTLGIIVYQEHVIRIFSEIAGFAPGTADSLRKKIAKKWGDESIGRERERFIKGAVEKTPGMTEEIAGKLMDAITFFGSYGFNKSHATAYGIIAYWCMYLKTYYPLEFYCALMKNEPDRLRIQRIAKAAKEREVDILPPDVSVSGVVFTIDYDKDAIRGSLIDIKNVGKKGAESIIKNQPYEDFIDFLKRVNRRQVNRRVVESLVKAGALQELVPNTKHFLENLDDYWALTSKDKWKALRAKLEESKGESDYPDEDKMLVASEVCPLAFGKHPMDAYNDFFERHIRVPIKLMGGEDFFHDAGNTWIAGVVVEVKYNQVGDFHSGELPDELERAKMMWGRRYANVNIEDQSGVQNRTKVDWDIFDDYRAVVDSGIGTPVLAHVTINKRYHNLRAHVLVDIEQLRRKIGAGEKLTLWEDIVCGKHPAWTFPWKKKAERALAQEDVEVVYAESKALANEKGAKAFRFTVTGLISHVREKPDKRGKMMAFFGVLGVSGYLEVVCFASCWGDFKDAIKPGVLATLKLKSEGGIFLDNRVSKAVTIVDSAE